MASIEGCSLVPASMEVACSEVDLGRLVRTYTPLLFRVAHSVLRNRAEAEDTVQDVFVRVLEHRRSLLAVQDMRLWLIRIAWNLAIDRRRRIRPDQLDEEFIGTLVAKNVPADQALHEAQRIQAVLRELDRLPKGERHVLLLTAVDELGTAEIGELLGRSESAIRALLFRARARLRDRLERGEVKR
jgi:RNA polymerase sigma-70 factor (ECF subfamily)